MAAAPSAAACGCMSNTAGVATEDSHVESDALLPEVLDAQRGGEHVLAGVVEDQHLPHEGRLGGVVERGAGGGRAGERAGRRRVCRRRVVEVEQREERVRLCVQQRGAGHRGVEMREARTAMRICMPSRWHSLRKLQSSE